MFAYAMDKKGPRSLRERKAIRVQTQNAINLFVFVNVEDALPTIERVKNLDISKRANRNKIHHSIAELMEEGDFDENNTVRIQNFVIQKIEEGLKRDNYDAYWDCSLAVISMLNSINHILSLYANQYRGSKLLKDMVSILISRTPEGIAKLYGRELPEGLLYCWPYLGEMMDAYYLNKTDE